MKNITINFDTLARTIVTVFEGLDIDEILSFMRLVLKPNGYTSRTFRKLYHAYQMRRDVYAMCYDTEYYIIEKVYKDTDGTILVTYIEHDEGGYNFIPTTTEWTLEINDFLHMVVGMSPFYRWE